MDIHDIFVGLLLWLAPEVLDTANFFPLSAFRFSLLNASLPTAYFLMNCSGNHVAICGNAIRIMMVRTIIRANGMMER